MEDGTEGEMQPNDEGEMVCAPKKAAKSPACRQNGESEEDCRSRKIPELVDEGMDQDQAVATAFDICKTACEVKGAKGAKGEVGDQLTEQQKRDAKWKNLNKVWDVFDAFIGVYLADETPVEDFEKLLDEAIALMKGAASKGLVSALVKPRDHSQKQPLEIGADKKDAQQIGAVLAQLQNVIDNALVQAAKLILEIAESEYGKSAAGRAAIADAVRSDKSIKAIKDAVGGLEKKLGIAAGEERPQDGGAPKQRSGGSGDVALGDLERFLEVRELLQSAATAAGNALARVNQTMRERRGARGH
jgi:hypothetical protein